MLFKTFQVKDLKHYHTRVQMGKNFFFCMRFVMHPTTGFGGFSMQSVSKDLVGEPMRLTRGELSLLMNFMASKSSRVATLDLGDGLVKFMRIEGQVLVSTYRRGKPRAIPIRSKHHDTVYRLIQEALRISRLPY